MTAKRQGDLFGPDGETIEVYRLSPPSVRSCSAKPCGRRIEWVLTAAGRWMPLDAPVRVMREVKQPDGRVASIVPAAASHFVTCPVAGQFRKMRGKRP